MSNAFITFDNGVETWTVSKDTRHGKEGYRVLRYTLHEGSLTWDETYMFFKSLDTVKAAFDGDIDLKATAIEEF